MNERLQRIDQLLHYLADLQKQNPNYILTERNVYYFLVRQGIEVEDRNYPVQQFFDDFIRNFKDHHNLNVFVDPNWQYFCQFISQKPDEDLTQYPNHIKLYIPLDAKHIYRGVDQIFNFLSDQNISHISKVGSNIRNDDIVVRLTKPDDAKKLIDFVKNSSYLQEGLLPTNPFLYQDGGIAMTCDGTLSFSNALSCMLTEYIQQKKNGQQLDNVGVYDFYSFVNSLYQDLYISHSADMNKISQYFPRVTNQKQISDLKWIFEIIQKSQQENFNFETYAEIYQNACKSDGALKQKQDSNNVMSLTELLEKGIAVMTQKLGSKEGAIYTLQTYLETGNDKLITRTDDLRTIYQTSNFCNQLRTFLTENKITLEQYATDIENNKNKNHVTDAAKKMRLVMDIMGSKYGEGTALATVAKYLETGNPNYLTKDYGLRKAIGQSDVRDQINRYLKDQNVSPEIFLSQLSANRSPEEYFEDACTITYTKYQSLYENGTSQISGEKWLSYAIGSYMQSGDPNGFTRDYNARFHVQNHVTPQNAKQAITQKLGTDIQKLNPSYGSFVTLCNEYAKTIAEESFIRN